MKRKSIKNNPGRLRDSAFKELTKAIKAYNKFNQPSAARGVSQQQEISENEFSWGKISAYKNLINARRNFFASYLPKNFHHVRRHFEKSEYIPSSRTDESNNPIFLNNLIFQIISTWGPVGYGDVHYLGPSSQSLLGCMAPPTLHFGFWGQLPEDRLYPVSFCHAAVWYGIDITNPDIVGLDLSTRMKCSGVGTIGTDTDNPYIEFDCNIYIIQYRGTGKSAGEIWSEYWNYTPYKSGQAFPDPSFETGNSDTVTTDTPGTVTLNPSNPEFCRYICDVMPGDSFIVYYSIGIDACDSAFDCAIFDWSNTGHFILYPPCAIEHALNPIYRGAITTAQYRIVVETADKENAGTDANVYLDLFGIGIDSGEFQLISLDPRIDPFERSSTSEFNLVLRELGTLQSLKVRHDNQGDNPGWFLNRIIVQNLTTEQTTVFPCGRWLATDEEDKLICLILHPE